jgi:hypothetical protein
MTNKSMKKNKTKKANKIRQRNNYPILHQKEQN